jgi:hypothetical protein
MVPGDDDSRGESDHEEVDHDVQEPPGIAVVLDHELGRLGQHPGRTCIDDDDLNYAPAANLLEQSCGVAHGRNLSLRKPEGRIHVTYYVDGAFQDSTFPKRNAPVAGNHRGVLSRSRALWHPRLGLPLRYAS